MNIRNEIKAYIVREGFTMSELVEKLAEQYGWSPSVPNLSDKLCRESLRYTANNVNQIARRVNSGGGVYPDEVDEITAKLTEVSGLFGNILEQRSKIK